MTAKRNGDTGKWNEPTNKKKMGKYFSHTFSQLDVKWTRFKSIICGLIVVNFSEFIRCLIKIVTFENVRIKCWPKSSKLYSHLFAVPRYVTFMLVRLFLFVQQHLMNVTCSFRMRKQMKSEYTRALGSLIHLFFALFLENIFTENVNIR